MSNYSPDEKFKTMALRLPTELGERIDEHSGNFNEELENRKKEPVRPHVKE